MAATPCESAQGQTSHLEPPWSWSVDDGNADNHYQHTFMLEYRHASSAFHSQPCGRLAVQEPLIVSLEPRELTLGCSHRRVSQFISRISCTPGTKRPSRGSAPAAHPHPRTSRGLGSSPPQHRALARRFADARRGPAPTKHCVPLPTLFHGPWSCLLPGLRVSGRPQFGALLGALALLEGLSPRGPSRRFEPSKLPSLRSNQ